MSTVISKILKHASDVPAEPITKPGFSKFKARFLLTADDGCPRYALRLMEFFPGGCTSFHGHQEEHLMYFLEGEGVDKNRWRRGADPKWRYTPPDAVREPPDQEYGQRHAEDDLHRPAPALEDWKGYYDYALRMRLTGIIPVGGLLVITKPG